MSDPKKIETKVVAPIPPSTDRQADEATSPQDRKTNPPITKIPSKPSLSDGVWDNY